MRSSARALHCLVLDGVYQCDDAGRVFVAAALSTYQEVQTLLRKLVDRTH